MEVLGILLDMGTRRTVFVPGNMPALVPKLLVPRLDRFVPARFVPKSLPPVNLPASGSEGIIARPSLAGGGRTPGDPMMTPLFV